MEVFAATYPQGTTSTFVASWNNYYGDGSTYAYANHYSKYVRARAEDDGYAYAGLTSSIMTAGFTKAHLKVQIFWTNDYDFGYWYNEKVLTCLLRIEHNGVSSWYFKTLTFDDYLQYTTFNYDWVNIVAGDKIQCYIGFRCVTDDWVEFAECYATFTTISCFSP